MTWVVNLGTDLPEASGLRIHAGDRAVLKQDWAGGGGGACYTQVGSLHMLLTALEHFSAPQGLLGGQV